MNDDLINITLEYLDLEVEGKDIEPWMLDHMRYITVTGKVTKYGDNIIKYKGVDIDKLVNLEILKEIICSCGKPSIKEYDIYIGCHNHTDNNLFCDYELCLFDCSVNGLCETCSTKCKHDYCGMILCKKCYAVYEGSCSQCKQYGG